MVTKVNSFAVIEKWSVYQEEALLRIAAGASLQSRVRPVSGLCCAPSASRICSSIPA